MAMPIVNANYAMMLRHRKYQVFPNHGGLEEGYIIIIMLRNLFERFCLKVFE